MEGTPSTPVPPVEHPPLEGWQLPGELGVAATPPHPKPRGSVDDVDINRGVRVLTQMFGISLLVLVALEWAHKFLGPHLDLDHSPNAYWVSGSIPTWFYAAVIAGTIAQGIYRARRVHEFFLDETFERADGLLVDANDEVRRRLGPGMLAMLAGGVAYELLALHPVLHGPPGSEQSVRFAFGVGLGIYASLCRALGVPIAAQY